MTKNKHLTKAQASAITRKIKESIESLNALIIEAWEGEAHLALGYPNWVKYAAAEFPKFKLTPETRKAAATEMKVAGMSNRATAAALGADESTIREDVKDSALSAGNPAVSAGSSTSKPPTKRASKPVSGNSVQGRVMAYEKVVAEHPTWQPKQIQTFMGKEDHKAVSRLRIAANAPAEVKQHLYDGTISISIVEAVIGHTNASVLTEDDLINIIRKIVNKQIPFTSTTGLRNLMVKIPLVHGRLRARWLDPMEAMTYEQLEIALLDQEADSLNARQSAQERRKAKATVTDLDKMLYGTKTYAWLDQVDVRLNTLVLHAEEVLTSNRLMGQGGEPDLHVRMREVGQRFLDIADHIEGLLSDAKQPSKKPNLSVVPPHVETDSDGNVTITGVIV